MNRRYRLFAYIAPAVLLADMVTKQLVHRRFALGESIDIIPDFFALTYVRNPGAAFSLLASAPDWFREPFFFLIPVAAIVFLWRALGKLEDHETVPAIGMSLVIAGAFGNLIDRTFFGFVIDFIDLHWKDIYHYPRFNIADCAIVIGVGLLLLPKRKTEVVS